MLTPLQRTITAEVAASDGARDILKQKEIGDFSGIKPKSVGRPILAARQ